MKRNVAKTAKQCFLAVEGLFYLWFLTCDITGAGDSTLVKFAAIALVAFAGLFAGKTSNGRIVTKALLFTVCADVFLLLLNRYYALGVTLFLVVQLLYTLRLSPAGKRGLALLSRAIPAGFAFWVSAPYGLMIALPAAYIVWFALNLVDGLRQAAVRRERSAILFATGLLLFFCCDLCVGAHNLPSGILPGWMPGFAACAMWAFYLPSQLLILCSTSVWAEKSSPMKS